MSDPAQVAAERINVDQCALGHPHLGLSKIKEIIRDAYAPQDVELQAYMEMLNEVQRVTGAANHVAGVFMVKAQAEALRRLIGAARPILMGARAAGPAAAQNRWDWSCPHGNTPLYPAHGWWCDGCFGALELALQDIDPDYEAALAEWQKGEQR